MKASRRALAIRATSLALMVMGVFLVQAAKALELWIAPWQRRGHGET